MLLPSTYWAALLLLVAGVLCWGSWANAQKATGKWRFELFYYDFSVGVVIVALIAAFTLGQLLPKELTFSDNFLIAGKRPMAWAVGSGAIFNLANLLLAAAVSVSGISVAFPISLGLGVIISALLSFAQNAQGSAILVLGGAILILVAIVLTAFSYSGLIDTKRAEAVAAFQADPRAKKKLASQPGASRGIAVSAVSGIFMGLFYPTLEWARLGDNGVAPYGLALLFSAGVFVSSLLLLPFFMNFPVQGDPVEFVAYFNGGAKLHLLGLMGGILWMAGALCFFITYGSPSAMVGLPWNYMLAQGAAVVAALWGLVAWKEFAGSQFRSKLLMFMMLFVFLTGLAMIAMAPLHAK